MQISLKVSWTLTEQGYSVRSYCLEESRTTAWSPLGFRVLYLKTEALI